MNPSAGDYAEDYLFDGNDCDDTDGSVDESDELPCFMSLLEHVVPENVEPRRIDKCNIRVE